MAVKIPKYQQKTSVAARLFPLQPAGARVSVFIDFMLRKTLLLTLLSAGLVGCATTSQITNLTPRQMPRNPDGLYLVEAEWESGQHSLRKDSLKPSVMVDYNFYPMQPGTRLTNRWEALVPVPADKKYLNYRIKVDFLYDAMPTPKPDSRLSAPFQLEIVDK
jgi:hypothetical protein